MATLHKTKPSAFGYKRAAYSVFSLDRPVTELVASGTLRKVHGIGPSSERIITEWIEKGESATVEDALVKAAAPVQADIQKRRAVRDAFLSWSSVLGINQARMAPPVASMARYRGDFQSIGWPAARSMRAASSRSTATRTLPANWSTWTTAWPTRASRRFPRTGSSTAGMMSASTTGDLRSEDARGERVPDFPFDEF